MTSRSTENPLLKKTRLLTQALIISGTLNIGLLATFAYVVVQDKYASIAIELQPLSDKKTCHGPTNAEVLTSYSLLPYQELLLRLENDELLEEGLSQRDLALTCLAAFHHLNLEKALSGHTLQKRTIPFSNGQEKIELPVYPGLDGEQFQAILKFAKTEKWPFTSQGLFYELKRSVHPRDPSLIEAFCLSAEYETAQTLFSKTGMPLSPAFLIELLSEGEWKCLCDFTSTQRAALDLSPDRRRALLLSYLNDHSKSAATLLLETDLEFVLKRCDDDQILGLFELSESAAHLEPFAKALLTSPRTDRVWKRAAMALYAQANEPMPDPYDHRIALQRFFPVREEQPKEKPVVVKNVKLNKKIYTVESGDNLWKISRKFRVSIEEIKRINHLETEKLRPGKQLEIPVAE